MATKNDPGAAARKAQQDAAVADQKAREAGNEALQASAEVASSSSSDAAHSTYEKNSDPNPFGLDPPPGPSTIQHLGLPSEG